MTVAAADGTETVEPFDVLLISTGTTNGFWRRPTLQTADDVAADLHDTHERLARAQRIAVVGRCHGGERCRESMRARGRTR